MKICVTQKDIDGGACHPGYCPIALSLKRMGFTNVRVGSGLIYVGRRRINLPRNAQTFISFFDNDVAVKPFSFTLPRLK